MRMYDLIAKKQTGLPLSKSEIEYAVDAYTHDIIPDYQMSALLMAIYFQGMNSEEQANLTNAMVKSGEIVDLSLIHGIKVDKHSTGGVGDTTTLITAPIVASLDIPVAKMSGRGLGHTGGTIDKLEAIPGFHVEISTQTFFDLINKNKIAIIGQSDDLAPADKKIYGLRDVTSTVSSIPLIASSIMSKKIAAGSDAIVLDVKTGNGAFMDNFAAAKKLANAMVKIGRNIGKETIATISNMNQPLGNAIGNSLEIIEAIETLKENGPDDLTALSIHLAKEMVALAKPELTSVEIDHLVKDTISNGNALKTFAKFIKAQGGNPEVINNYDLLPRAKHSQKVIARKNGYISSIIANEIGIAAMKLGAGRITKDSKLDLAAGLIIHKKIGDKVSIGDCLCTIYYNQTDTKIIREIMTDILENMIITDGKPIKQPLIYETIR